VFREYVDLPRRVHVLCLGQFVQRAGSFILPFLAIDLESRRGLGEAFVTYALGALGAGAFGGSLLGGMLADRVGRRPTLLAALCGTAVWSLVLAVLQQPFAIFAAVFGFALTANLYPPACQAMLADLTDEAARPRAYALFYAAMNLGFAVGSALGGQIAVYSYFWLFAGEAIGSAAFGLFVLLLVPESRPSRPARPLRSELSGLRLPADRAFAALLLANFLLGLLFQQSFSTLPLAMLRDGLNPDAYGGVMAVNGTMIALFQLPLTVWLAKRRTRPLLTLAALLLGAGFGANAVAGSAAGYVAALLVWTTGELVLAARNQAAVATLAPLELRASYFGAFTACQGLAMLLGPLAGGLLLVRAGAPVLWGTCALIGVLAAAVFASAGPRVDA
jgi:MFS family permease